jgi:hypothetical protein
VSSFHVPPETEIEAHREALAPSNVVELHPRHRQPSVAATVALIAERNRLLTVSAAAIYVDTLRAAVLSAPPEAVTKARVADMLAITAAEIRKLGLQGGGDGGGRAA